MIEVECRIELSRKEFKKIKNSLEDKITKELDQADTYYNPPHRDFAITDKGRDFLRVRLNKNKNCELTYKHAKYDENNKLERMLEQTVTIDDCQTLKEILETIGFRRYLTVNKKRYVAEIPNFEICLDQIKDLGYFVEIEYTGEITDEKEAYQACLNQTKILNVANPKTCDIGYVQMLEQKSGNSINKNSS